jgi:hypothetical protein
MIAHLFRHMGVLVDAQDNLYDKYFKAKGTSMLIYWLNFILYASWVMWRLTTARSRPSRPKI